MIAIRIAAAALAAVLGLSFALPASAQYVTKRSSTGYAVQGPTKTKRSGSTTSQQQRGQTLSTQQRNSNAQSNAVGQARAAPAQPQKR